MDKYIGRLLDNRYEILEVIGTGGMAVVYKARCHRLNRLVAIKILKDDYLQDVEFRRRFHAESQAVAMLGHPNIVAVYDVSTSDEADYIVMELIDGITLKQYMEKKGVLNWKETLHFAIQIAKALEHAHSRGIVHRDIKPHNIMVLKNGSVKVADFGIARMMSKGNTLTKEALGSVHYISPEQAKGGRVDNRSDIYSLGVVMYEMMSGRPPYDGESPVAVAIQHINGGAVMPSTLNPNIPGGLEQIIMKAMAHDPADRYPTATQMLQDMDEFRKNPAILFDYHTPPLDAVTRIQRIREPLESSAVRTVAERTAGRAEGIKRRESAAPARRTDSRSRRREEDARSSNGAIIAVVSCSAVVVIAIILFLVLFLNGGFPSRSRQVTVPSLLGENYDTLPVYADLKIQQEPNKRYDDTHAPGIIIEQQPVAGEKVDRGSTIFVTVSLGKEPEVILMEDLTGWQDTQAKSFLVQYSLQLDVTLLEEPSVAVEKGLVTRTDPAQGVELTHGQKVTVWISSGPEVITAKMPNVVGMNIATAINMLQAQGFDRDNCNYEYVNSNAAKDEVIEQSIAKDTQVDIKSTILLMVSSGSVPTQPPQTDPPTEATEEPAKTKWVQVELTDGLWREDGQEHTLTICLPDGTEVHRNEKFKDSSLTYAVQLSGSGVQYFELYIDGVRNAEPIRVDFTTDD